MTRGVISKLAARRSEVMKMACPSGALAKTVLPLSVFGLCASYKGILVIRQVSIYIFGGVVWTAHIFAFLSFGGHLICFKS